MKALTCLGRKFPSQKALAAAFGLDPMKVARRLRAGWTPEEAVERAVRPRPGTVKPVMAFGVTYRNLAEVALAHQVHHALLANRVLRGYSVEDAIVGRRRENKGARREIVFEGKKYESREALCRTHGQSWNNVQRRIARGWTMRQALTLDPPPPRFRDFDGHARSHSWKSARVEGERTVPAPGPGGYKLYLIRHIESGKEYVGITTGDLSLRFKQHVAAARRGRKSALYNAIRAHGEDAFVITLLSDQAQTYAELEAMEISQIAQRDSIRKGYNTAQGGGLSTSRSVVVAGIAYPSIAAAAAAYGVDARVFAIRLARLGWSPEEAAGLLDKTWSGKAKPVVVAGRTFRSLQEAAKKIGLSYKTVHARLRRGWSLERAFGIDESSS